MQNGRRRRKGEEETNVRETSSGSPQLVKNEHRLRTLPTLKAGGNGGERRKWKRPVASIYQGCWNGTGVIVGTGLARAPIIDG